MVRDVYNAGIIGVATYMPEQVRKNDFWDNITFLDLPKKDKDPFMGIEERRVFPDDAVPSDVEAEAGRRALRNSGVHPDDIDLVIVHSMIQDEIIPGNASLVQHKIGLKNSGAWNMDTCCASFVTMMITASNLIAMGTFKNILIITSVLHAQIMDYSSYQSPYYGDGAGAIVMGRVSEGRGYIASHCWSNGQYHNAFTVRDRMPLNARHVHYKASPSKPMLTLAADNVNRIGRNSIEDMADMMNKALEKAGISAGDIDFLLTHQPCYWAHDAWRDAIGVPPEKSLHTFRKYGNLASTSIPANLDEAVKTGRLKDGDIILFASSGAGENFSIVVLKWGR